MLLYIAYIIFYNFKTIIYGKFLGSHSVSAASSSAIIEFNFGRVAAIKVAANKYR